MKRYLGVKMIDAKPMNLGAYNHYKGWIIPDLQIKMTNGSHAMWVPSINDVLAEDWVVLN